ncbi:MAG: 4Fe-4S binding protein [Lachnospiraceae bacterium]|nr:4Fe-4S binding protein [Lachnospiraceae bacterium]
MTAFQENKDAVKQPVFGKEGKTLTAGQLKKKKAAIQRLMRAVIQAIFFITMPSAFVAGFSGVKYIFNQIGTGSVLEVGSFLITLIGLVIFTILFGRYFCGYVCAFGTLGDFVFWISGFVQAKIFRKKKQFSLQESCFSVCQKIKYLILTLIVVFCALGIYGKFSGTSPWDVFSMMTAGRFNLKGYAVGMILFLAILVGMALQERFFCQFLCPMGAVFALLPILPISVLKRNEASCRKGCSLCQKKCPVHLKLTDDSLLSGECIRCGKCAADCPGENIQFTGRLTGNELWLVIVQAVIFFIMGTLLGLCRFI